MQITPRYDGPPVLEIDFPLRDVSVPLLRQRRRLGDILSELDEQQWAAPSRCDEWTVQDVIAHLVGTNQYWAISIGSGLAGKPTRYLAAFDPVATPAQMVDDLHAMSSAEVLSQYLASLEQLADVVRDLDEQSWSMPAEAPPGHISVRAVALHALWDAWTHERDIVLPLGRAQSIEPDEVIGCLLYCASIGPALAASRGSTRVGALAIRATDPDVSFVVHAGPTVTVTDAAPPEDARQLTGDAVALVEGLTFRTPFEHCLSEADAWLVAGLDEVFDRASA